MAVSPEELALAQDTANKIVARANALLVPLEREMTVMRWGADYRAIMWETVMREAATRMRAAEKENGR